MNSESLFLILEASFVALLRVAVSAMQPHCRQGLPWRLACSLAFLWFGPSPSLASTIATLFPGRRFGTWSSKGLRAEEKLSWDCGPPDAARKTQTPRGEWSAFCRPQGTRYGTKCHRLWSAWPQALPWYAQMLSFSPLVTSHLPRCQEALKTFSWAMYTERRKSWRRKGERRQEETYLRNNSQCLLRARLYTRQFTLQYII